MKIVLGNIGVIRWAEFGLSPFTIICGDNNSGKSYASYAFYGFLYFFNTIYRLKLPDDFIGDFINSGSAVYDVDKSLDELNLIVADACEQYSRRIYVTFAAPETMFKDSTFKIVLEKEDVRILDSYSKNFKNNSTEMVQVLKKGAGDKLHFSWISAEGSNLISNSFKSMLALVFSDVIKEVIFGKILPSVFVTSAERTGAAIFSNDIVTVSIPNDKDSAINSRYPLPIKDNVDFIRNFDFISRLSGNLCELHPDILEEFVKIAGGRYEKDSTTGNVLFEPTGSKRKYQMAQSASSVRALMDLFFYLKHVAAPGQLIIIDEPELNLHPSRQIMMARLLTMLVKFGLRVMITTHSDYIVREVNNLLLLENHNGSKAVDEILDKYGINKGSLISHESVSVYSAKRDLIKIPGFNRRQRVDTLVESTFNPDFGFEGLLLDDTLKMVNLMQQDILLADYES